MMTYLLLFAAVLIGSIAGVLIKNISGNSIKFMLTFSGAYLLSIGVLHLLPEVYEEHNHFMGLFIVLGFLVQLLLEVLSKGVEHGHRHNEYFTNRTIPFGIMTGLFAHAFLEGMPVGAHIAHDNELSKNAMLWGLFVHKIPVSLILYAMLSEMTDNKIKVTLWLIAFAIMGPLGALIGQHWSFLTNYYHELTAFVFGIFLHISTTILFESTQSHRFNIFKFLTVIIGIAAAWLSVSHH